MRFSMHFSNFLTHRNKSRVFRQRKPLLGLLWILLLLYYAQTCIHFFTEFIFKTNYNAVTWRPNKDIAAPPIPKIIHQIFFNLSDNRVEFMEKYRPFQQSWKDHNPDHQYILWNAAMIDKLIDERYPKVKPLYWKYEHKWVSRADMARYLVVHHMGGVYADLDVECKQSLNTLYEESNSKGLLLNFTYNPVGVANDFFAASRHHTFMRHVIDGLNEADVPYLVPYMGTMFRTGPVFMFGRYLNYPFPDDIYWIPPETILRLTDRTKHGKSWHEFDGQLLDLLWTKTGPKKLLLYASPFICLYIVITRYYMPKRRGRPAIVTRRGLLQY